MLIDEYFQQIEAVIARYPMILKIELVKDKRSPSIGFIEGKFTFLNGSLLHFVEFVNVKETIERYKYSYHYHDQQKQLIFRYDMAPHHQDITTFPHHKHLGSDQVIASNAPTLQEILDEVEQSNVSTTP